MNPVTWTVEWAEGRTKGLAEGLSTADKKDEYKLRAMLRAATSPPPAAAAPPGGEYNIVADASPAAGMLPLFRCTLNSAALGLAPSGCGWYGVVAPLLEARLARGMMEEHANTCQHTTRRLPDATIPAQLAPA
jgi:hypothetical protein